MSGPIEVVELAPDRVEDYFALFDHAFPDNPSWAGCYCGFYDDPSDRPWDNVQDALAHRAARKARIRAGEASGVLAYVAGRPVGWCNVARRSRHGNLRTLIQAVEDPAEDPALIMCFVIAPEHRGRGVATALTEAAVALAREWGAPWVEAYPPRPDHDPSPLPWTAASYKGPLSMYERAGFTVVREFASFLVVRRRLDGDPPAARSLQPG
jgi:GNAT superfamily N-acetyltransferase